MDSFIVLKQYLFPLYCNNIWNWIENKDKHENYQ